MDLKKIKAMDAELDTKYKLKHIVVDGNVSKDKLVRTMMQWVKVGDLLLTNSKSLTETQRNKLTGGMNFIIDFLDLKEK